MKAGRALDADVAIKILNKHPKNIKSIPHYSTNIFDAYKIISSFQTNNWSCSVNANVMSDGNLMYRVRFHKKNIECERLAPTMPLAICMTAMSVINDEYIEFVGKEDKNDISISEKMPQLGVEKIDFYDETFLEMLEKIIKETDKDNLVENIVDILSKSGYSIIRKKPEDF